MRKYSSLLASVFLLVLATACSKSTKPDSSEAARDFANQHWSDVPYWDSLLSVRNVAKWKDGDEFPHHLPYEITVGGDTVALKNPEYYENIGKYQQFIWGWDDLTQISSSAAEPEDNYNSAHRSEYVSMMFP